MEQIAAPADPERIREELTERSLIATFRGLEIHLVVAHEAPTTLEEIGRIREQEYRRVGAGRGVERDLDSFDVDWPWYFQLVSWDPVEGEIVAAYRAIRCDWAIRHRGIEALRSNGLFEFSKQYIDDYLMRSIELARSVVNAEAKKAISGLFSVWVGLGAMVREWPEVGYFVGMVSLYRSLPPRGISAVVSFLLQFHRAPTGLLSARTPVAPEFRDRTWPQESPAEALQAVLAEASADGWPFPPILLSYLKAHPGLLAFDVAEDAEFGGAFEVAIAMPTEGVNDRTVSRFITPYESINPDRFRLPEAPPADT